MTSPVYKSDPLAQVSMISGFKDVGKGVYCITLLQLRTKMRTQMNFKGINVGTKLRLKAMALLRGYSSLPASG